MTKLLNFMMGLLPLRNYILFESHSDFCDNSKSLYDYMMSIGVQKKYRMVWFVEYPERFKEASYENTIFLQLLPKTFKEKLKLKYYVECAKFAFFSHRSLERVSKKGSIFVNLWHGTGPKNPSRCNLGRNFDYVFYSSDLFKESYIKYLSCKENQLMPMGNLRNDILFKNSDVLKRIVNRSYSKTLIWMPTFRVNKSGSHDFETKEYHQFGLPLVENVALLERLNEKLKEKDVLMIVKLHPAQDMKGIDLLDMDHVLFLTNDQLDDVNIQLYEMLHEIDGLITDFSSVYVDYLLIDRPCAFTVDDLDDFKTGFFFDNVRDYLPGPQMMTFEDILAFIDDFAEGIDPYQNERTRVNELFNEYRDGRLCERVTKHFLNM